MRNMLIRVAKTFVATFFGTLAVLVPTINFSDANGFLQTLAIAAASSIITAVMNIPRIKAILNNYGETPEGIASDITEKMRALLKDISEEDE